MGATIPGWAALPSYQPALDLAKGTYTNTYLCTYTTAGTLLDCNTNPASFQTALTYPVTGVETPTAGYLTKWGPSGNAIVDGPKIGIFTDTKWCSFSTAGGLECTESEPAGGHDAVTLSGDPIAAIFSLSTQALSLDTQAANYVLAGPVSGDAAAPAFRALVSTDIPNNAADTSGTAAKATALAANGANCDAGSAPLGVNASGASESCFAVQPSNADLTAIAALTCTENQIMKMNGADAWVCAADNDSAGTPTAITVADTTDTTSYVGLFESATGDLGPKTDGGITYNAGTGMLTVTGLTAGTGGVTVSKQSGVAGDMSVYEANSTDTHGAGFRGPASITGDGAYRILFPDARASSANMVLAVTNAGESGDGAAATPYVQTGSWIDLDDKAPVANPVFTGVVDVPVNATTDAEGEWTIDTTSDQVRFYGAAQKAIPSLQYASFVIPAPVDTDDILIMKAPYGMVITAVNCIVQGTTSITGQLQECTSAGASCADTDTGSDIVCDADGAADDGTLANNSIDSGDWIMWKSTSASGTPTFLTVTLSYTVVAD